MAKANYGKFVTANAKRLPPPDSDTPAARYRTMLREKGKRAKKLAAPGTSVTLDVSGDRPVYNFKKKKRRTSPNPSSNIGPTKTA